MKLEFSKPEVDHFKEVCNFSKQEELILDLRVKGLSITEISLSIPTSESTVNRRIKSIKRKIYKVL